MGEPKRVALVTGASGNLGTAVCARLLHEGMEVVRVERAQATLDGAKLADVDMGSAASLAELVRAVLARCGRLDCVVHTVGTFRASGPAHVPELEAYDFLFENNVMTTVRLLAAVLGPLRVRGHGRVVVVSSTAALRGGAELAAYSASKAAQLRVVESAARELAGTDVTVSTVLPGTMDTPANRRAMPDADRSSWVSLEEVAEVIAFLASPGGAVLHGRAVEVSRAP